MTSVLLMIPLLLLADAEATPGRVGIAHPDGTTTGCLFWEKNEAVSAAAAGDVIMIEKNHIFEDTLVIQLELELRVSEPGCVVPADVAVERFYLDGIVGRPIQIDAPTAIPVGIYGASIIRGFANTIDGRPSTIWSVGAPVIHRCTKGLFLGLLLSAPGCPAPVPSSPPPEDTGERDPAPGALVPTLIGGSIGLVFKGALGQSRPLLDSVELGVRAADVNCELFDHYYDHCVPCSDGSGLFCITMEILAVPTEHTNPFPIRTPEQIAADPDCAQAP